MLSCPSECWKHLSWQTWFTFIVDVWRERMVIDVFKAVLVSERQCLWSQASLALAFLAHSMWLRAAGLAGSTEKSRASRCRARCRASRCKVQGSTKSEKIVPLTQKRVADCPVALSHITPTRSNIVFIGESLRELTVLEWRLISIWKDIGKSFPVRLHWVI